MKRKPYRLTSPCALCPFRTDIVPYLRPARAVEIRRSIVRSEFPCHETTGATGKKPIGGEAHCAGALIMLEHAGQPSQMMRIAERLRMYDRRKLDMDAPVYDDPDEWVAAHKPRKRRKR